MQPVFLLIPLSKSVLVVQLRFSLQTNPLALPANHATVVAKSKGGIFVKIAIIGATGKAGALLLEEAVNRGLDTLAIVRHSEKLPADYKGRVLEKDLLDLAYADLEAEDVIIDAFGISDPAKQELHKTTLKHLADILSGHPNRLLVVGGAGSLFVDAAHTQRLMDTPDFPAAYLPTASNMGEALADLQKREDVQWTYLSPAPAFLSDGERTGQYKVGKDEVVTDSQGKPEISYADYAIAMIDEAEDGKHIQERFTVSWA